MIFLYDSHKHKKCRKLVFTNSFSNLPPDFCTTQAAATHRYEQRPNASCRPYCRICAAHASQHVWGTPSLANLGSQFSRLRVRVTDICWRLSCTTAVCCVRVPHVMLRQAALVWYDGVDVVPGQSWVWPAHSSNGSVAIRRTATVATGYAVVAERAAPTLAPSRPCCPRGRCDHGWVAHVK